MEPQQSDSPMSETPVALPSASDQSGPSSRKGKAPHEYSTNANTVRVRQRTARLTPYQLSVERARSNDLKAISAAWKDRVKSENLQQFSEIKNRKIFEEVKSDVMDRRRRKKIDADSKIFALNQQLEPDENVSGPHSGFVPNNAAGRFIPQTARPGYVDFPTRIIPEFMVAPKETAPSYVNPATPAPNSASTSAFTLVGNETVQPPSAYLDDSVANFPGSEVSNAIQNLKGQISRFEAEIQKLRVVMEDMRDQMNTFLQTTQMSTLHHTPIPLISGLTRNPTLPQTPIPQPAHQYDYHYDDYDMDDHDGHTADDAEAEDMHSLTRNWFNLKALDEDTL
ncbi:hypothetical protein F5Y12DRAFT_720359 [Xylaria sp. FL1777]|nr:hypothetical protein F5Y12DRAFT_720359 [Xylaria sp. FL1777]